MANALDIIEAVEPEAQTTALRCKVVFAEPVGTALGRMAKSWGRELLQSNGSRAMVGG